MKTPKQIKKMIQLCEGLRQSGLGVDEQIYWIDALKWALNEKEAFKNE